MLSQHPTPELRAAMSMSHATELLVGSRSGDSCQRCHACRGVTDQATLRLRRLLAALMVLSIASQAGCYRAAQNAEQEHVELRVSRDSVAGLAMTVIEEALRSADTDAARSAQRAAGLVVATREVGGAFVLAQDEMLSQALRGDISGLVEGRAFLTRPCRAMNGDTCVRRDLDRFFEKLRALWLGESDENAVYAQWGDSLVINDHYTGELRRRLQARFGDAGHGFLFMGNPVRHMGFQGIRLALSERWQVRSIIRESGTSGIAFGFAGAEFVPNANPSFRIRSDYDENDREFRRFGVLYHVPESVGTGTLRYEDDDGTREVSLPPISGREGLVWVDTERLVSDVRFDGFDQRLKYYGIIVETGDPGVIVDNLGLVSGRIFFLLKIEEEQWAEQVDLRDPDVMSLWYGVNSSGMERDVFQRRRPEYEQQYREVLRRVRSHHPDRDCMVISVGTRGDAVGRHVINDDSLDLVAEVARDVSAEAYCAFLDAYEMIGGETSASDWYFARPQLMADDLHHFTVRGYWRFAELVERELMREFLGYLSERRERLRRGLPPYQRLAE